MYLHMHRPVRVGLTHKQRIWTITDKQWYACSPSAFSPSFLKPVSFKSDPLQDQREIFKVFDLDGTDEVSLDRLGDLIRSAGLNPTESWLRETKDDLVKAKSTISFREFRELVDNFHQAPLDVDGVKYALRTLDHDNSGTISVEEFKSCKFQTNPSFITTPHLSDDARRR